jgi:hypothetical protein
MTSNSFNIIASDGITVTVDASLLSNYSTVFNTMLSLPQSNGEADNKQECTVTESSEDFKTMMSALGGKGSSIPDTEIGSLIAMADKYDAPFLTEICTNLVW